MANKLMRILTVVDDGDTISFSPHNLGTSLLEGESELTFLKQAQRSTYVNSSKPAAPVDIVTIVEDGFNIKFMCHHVDGKTSLGLSRDALAFIDEAILFAKQKLSEAKKSIQHENSKPMQGWNQD